MDTLQVRLLNRAGLAGARAHTHTHTHERIIFRVSTGTVQGVVTEDNQEPWLKFRYNR